MEYGLTCRFVYIDPDIIAIRVKTFVNLSLHILQHDIHSLPFMIGKVKVTGNMPLGNDKGIPREDIIIATGHENTQMLDKIYAHLTAKDKSQKVTSAFKKKLGDGIFNKIGRASCRERV